MSDTLKELLLLLGYFAACGVFLFIVMWVLGYFPEPKDDENDGS